MYSVGGVASKCVSLYSVVGVASKCVRAYSVVGVASGLCTQLYNKKMDFLNGVFVTN